MTRKRKKKPIEPGFVQLHINVTRETRELITVMARKLGVRQANLSGMWMAQFDPNNEMLLEKIRHLKAKDEADRLAASRNALLAKLYGKAFMQEILDMDNGDLNVLINRIQNRKNK